MRRLVLAAVLCWLGCSAEPAARDVQAPAAPCSWSIEYSRHSLLDEPPKSSRIGGVILEGDDVVRVSFVDGSGSAGVLESFDAAVIEFGASGSLKLAELYAGDWEADVPIAGNAILRIAGPKPDLARMRLVVGHPAPIRILRSGANAVLHMPLIEGSLKRVSQAGADGCVGGTRTPPPQGHADDG